MKGADLRMTERREPECTRLIVSGELDMATVPHFQQRVGALRARKRAVRLDLSRLEFMDAAGLRAVATAVRDRRAGLSPIDVDPSFSPQVGRLVALLGCGLEGS
jgi:anti-anti-sigma factor